MGKLIGTIGAGCCLGLDREHPVRGSGHSTLGHSDEASNLYAPNEGPGYRLSPFTGDTPADGAETIAAIKLVRQAAYLTRCFSQPAFEANPLLESASESMINNAGNTQARAVAAARRTRSCADSANEAQWSRMARSQGFPAGGYPYADGLSTKEDQGGPGAKDVAGY